MTRYKSYILLASIFFIFGFLLNHFLSSRSLQNPTISISTSPIPTSLENSKGNIPECVYGICPRYLTSDVSFGHGDVWTTVSVITIPTAMTRGAGQVWLIQNGNILYKTPELPEISAKIEKGNLYITYASEWQEDGMHPSLYATYQVQYENKQFSLDKVSTQKVQ